MILLMIILVSSNGHVNVSINANADNTYCPFPTEAASIRQAR